MRKFLGLCTIVGLVALVGTARGQGQAPSSLSSRLTPESSPSAPPKEVKPAATKSPAPELKPGESPAPGQEIVTEIYADKAVFDSGKSTGVFSGHIVVIDPRFQIQGDKLTIYLSNKQSEGGLDKAVVEGNVGVVRDRADPAGGPPSRMVGRSDKAVYTAKTGYFELTGNPRVQQGLNTHVATSPETVMILNDKGELQTTGPSRTEIRQPPKSETTPTPSPTSTPKPTPKP